MTGIDFLCIYLIMTKTNSKTHSLRSLRRSKGLRLSDVHVLAEIDPSTLSEIENAKRTPLISTLQKLTKAYDVKYETIWKAMQETQQQVKEETTA